MHAPFSEGACINQTTVRRIKQECIEKARDVALDTNVYRGWCFMVLGGSSREMGQYWPISKAVSTMIR